jgi:ATP-binding cassette subfamily C exporter for protease/lipase
MARQPDEFRLALRGSASALAGAAIFSGAINLLYLASPLYLMQIYNRVLTSGSMPTLWMLTFALVVALLTMALLDAIRARVLVRGAMRFDRLLAARLAGAMIDRGSIAGNENAQVLRDLDLFRGVLAGPSVHFLFDIPWTPLYLAILFWIDMTLGLVATGGAVLLLILAFINDRATRAQLTLSQAAGERAQAFADSIARNTDVVRAMAMRVPLVTRWQRDRQLMLRLQSKASNIAGGLTASIRFFRLLLQAAILAVGAWLALDHVILPVTIFASIIAPVEQAVIAWRQFGSAGEATRRIRRLLAEQPAPAERTKLPRPKGELVLTNVTYTPEGGPPVIKGISFSLESGESLGVVGSSGAGKTTLARLIAGALPPSSGSVQLDGVDLRRWEPEDLGRHIGYLPDHVGLFAGSVKENIARFRDVPDETVIAAAKRACIHDLVLGLPDGYDTLIREGGRELSRGQRQRVGIARALLGSPQLVVLDEPNAHLDADGERALDQVIADLTQDGVTVVVVTHRSSVLGALQKFLVLEAGRMEMLGPREDVTDSLRPRAIRAVQE